MTCASAVSASGQAAIRSGRLFPPPAVYMGACITVCFSAGCSAPTAIYALYQAEWGFSPITVTVVFGIYALALPDSGAEGIECAD